jgi:hypothetical protein
MTWTVAQRIAWTQWHEGLDRGIAICAWPRHITPGNKVTRRPGNRGKPPGLLVARMPGNWVAYSVEACKADGNTAWKLWSKGPGVRAGTLEATAVGPLGRPVGGQCEGAPTYGISDQPKTDSHEQEVGPRGLLSASCDRGQTTLRSHQVHGGGLRECYGVDRARLAIEARQPM